MKRCPHCLTEFNNENLKDCGLLHELWSIFLACSVNVNINMLCPECRELMDMFTLLKDTPNQ
ncbi:MAG: hypothetical protein FJ139_05920 [Deltaproteobacteria bacterium]|nr:hypothetical protein [Deltaproteobacteria bacterium]